MVKSRTFKKKTKESLEDYDHMSKFIDPTIDYTKEELCNISTPKKYDPSPAENFHLPSRHIYSSFIDFTAKKFSEHIEDPLNSNEIEEGCRLAREIVDEFALSAPDYNLTQNDLTKEIKQGLSIGKILSCINNSKFREDFIDFLGEYQTKHINDRGLKNGIKEPIKHSHKVKIIKYYEAHKTTKEICKEFLGKYSARIIDEFIEFYLKNGNDAVNMEFIAKPSYKLNEEQVRFLLELAEDPKNIGLTLEERKHLLCEHFGIKVKSDDVGEVLKENGFSMKRIRAVVPEADNIPHKNARCRVAQQLVYFFKAGKELISVDETQVTRGDNLIFGWSKKGIRATKVVERKGRPIHIIAAVSKDRVIGYMIRYNKIEKNTYKHFMLCLFEKLKEIDPENYKTRFFVLMDNAGAHKHKVVKDFLESQEVIVLCNAPTTPQLQPIEFAFSMFKRNLNKLKLEDEEELLWAIYNSFKKITPRQLHNTYLHTMRAYESGLMYSNFQHNRNPYVTDGRIRRSGKLLSRMINFEKLFGKKDKAEEYI